MELLYKDDATQLYWGNAMEIVDKLPENSIQSVITSPTYWGKRKFTDDTLELGSESLEEYVERNVFLYAMILGKLLKDDGSLFVIIQDSYMGSGISRSHHTHAESLQRPEFLRDGIDPKKQGNTSSVTARHDTIKNKSLCGLPWRIAIELVDKGYIWRELLIWEKKNPMPDNVQDRVRQSSEYILHFTRKGKYKFHKKYFEVLGNSGKPRMSNQVWKINPKPKEGHTATFPKELVTKLLLATTDKGDTVFEPFLGSGTMLDVCQLHKRKFIGIDINKKFVIKSIQRLKSSISHYIKKDE